MTYQFNPQLIPNIPNELTQFTQWVVWRYEARDNGKFSKVPYSPKTGKQAKSNNPDTWVKFNDTFNCLGTGKYNGIGFMFSANDGIIGIDIDHCIVDGQFIKEVFEIIEKFKPSYTEISPSGQGIRIFCKGSFQRFGKNTGSNKWLEVYNHTSPRYLTVTGNILEGSGKAIVDCQDSLNWFYETYFKPAPATKSTKNPPANVQTTVKPALNTDLSTPNKELTTIPFLADDDVLNIIKRSKQASKFEQLWAGGGNEDFSSGDLALCSMLAFYTHSPSGGGYEQLNRLFMRSNRIRDKWHEKHGSTSYGDMTINKAVAGLTDFYKPRKNAPTSTKKSESRQLSELSTPPKFRYFTKSGNPTICLLNIKIALETKLWRGVLARNDFTGYLVKRNSPPYSQSQVGDWLDTDNTKTALWISEQFEFNPPTSNIQEIVDVIGLDNHFHPVKDYLNSCKWDGVPRVENWLHRYLGADDNQYTQLIGTTWLISAIARVMVAGVKADNVLILEGNQGIGKSTALKLLFGDYFSDTPIDIGSKDAYIALRGKWCVELAELDSLNKADSERAKAFFSSSEDKYRPPYGKNEISLKRQCVFAGTANHETYLKDATGNRRYLPVKCNQIDLEAIKNERDLLWAEALALYNQGVKWWFDANIDFVKSEQEARYERDVWTEVIEGYIKDKQDVMLDDIFSPMCLDIDVPKRDKRAQMRVGAVLRSLGFKRMRKMANSVRCYVYVKEQQVNQQPDKQQSVLPANLHPADLELFKSLTSSMNQNEIIELCNGYDATFNNSLNNAHHEESLAEARENARNDAIEWLRKNINDFN